LSDRYLLAVDAGSSGGHSLIIDLQGHVVSSAYREWTYDTPAELAPLGKEFDPEQFWEIICQLIGEAITRAPIASCEVIAVSAASQRQGVVFLDKDGHELYAGPNVDVRALFEGLSIDGEFGNEVYQITGHTPSLLGAPAKLRWFKNNRPHVYQRIATTLSISDWIIYRLSGERVGDVSSESEVGLVDIHELIWSQRLVEMLQLPQGIYPEIVSPGTRVGAVTAATAEQTGLTPGTAVVIGGADTQCGLLGMGVKDEGHVGIVAGWSAPVQMVTTQPTIDSRGRLWTGCHVLPGRWILESNAGESGGAYRWLGEVIFGRSNTAEDIYALMDELAQEVAPGAAGVLAFIGPRAMDMSCLRPSLGGFILPVTPSVAHIERKHLIRAAQENLCFALKINCAQLEEVSGLRVKEVSIGGGLARSRSLVQMLSDTLGMPVASFDMPQVTSLGIAMCAATGSGIHPDLEQAMEAMRPKSILFEPDPKRSQEYTECYRKWLSTAKWLEDLSGV